MSKIKHIMEQAFENELKALDAELEMEDEFEEVDWDWHWLLDDTLDTTK